MKRNPVRRDVPPLRTLGSLGFTAEQNQIIAVATSTRFKSGQMISWKRSTISYNGSSRCLSHAAAPILNRESMQEFRKRPELQQNLRVSFLRMMKFYGLEVDFAEQIKVTRTRYFGAKATVWVSPGNHNHLRITRILRCLNCLGLEAEARAFFECLSEIYESEQSQPRPAISNETILYWRRAVGDVVC